MIRTQMLRCTLPKETADALNRESGRIYTATLVEHYRVYRHTGNWLSPKADEKLSDFITGETLLHAYSRDAAQQGFAKACKTARACQAAGLTTRYPHKCKVWHTTIWKNTGIRKREGVLLLALAKGNPPILVALPPQMRGLPSEAFVEMRLVCDKAAQHYQWYAVIENGTAPGWAQAQTPPESTWRDPSRDGFGWHRVGGLHPRQLRSLSQYSNKRLAELQAKQVKGSKRWKRIQRRKNRFLAQQKRRKRDIEHKVSRAVVAWTVEKRVGTLAVGEVRDAADGVDLGKQANQKISNWTHGKLRIYSEYKPAAKGIAVGLVNEAYTSQTCPSCGERYKPKGRVYRCPTCGFFSHRDIVGAANIRSVCLYGKPGQSPPGAIKYRRPYVIRRRSRPDTAQVARP